MKKEDGMTALNLLLTIVITVIIAGVIFAMVYQKPTIIQMLMKIQIQAQIQMCKTKEKI